MTLRDKARAAAEKWIPCLCDEAYTSRGLKAPDCPRCNYAADIADAMVKIATDHAERALLAIRFGDGRIHVGLSENEIAAALEAAGCAK